MLRIDGKGGGLGQLLLAVGAALLLRMFSAPGPALLLDNEEEEDDDYESNVDAGKDAPVVTGKVFPVTIKWKNITCCLSNKSSQSVRTVYLYFHSISLIIIIRFVRGKTIYSVLLRVFFVSGMVLEYPFKIEGQKGK